MTLQDLISALMAIEHRYMGETIHVEIADEAGVFTSNIKITTEIVFAGSGRKTVRIQVADPTD